VPGRNNRPFYLGDDLKDLMAYARPGLLELEASDRLRSGSSSRSMMFPRMRAQCPLPEGGRSGKREACEELGVACKLA